MGRTNTTSTNRLESESAIGRSIKMVPPRLDQIPSELIDAIASFLSRRDILTFRFVCHALRSESELVFRREFFTSRITSLDIDDLHALLEVSRHPKFSGDIKTLRINVKRLARSTSSQCPLDLCEPFIIGAEQKEIFRDPHNQPLQEYRNTLRKLYEDQEFADRTGLQTAVLTSILRNLPALTSIDVGRGFRSSFRRKVDDGWRPAGMHELVADDSFAKFKMFDDDFGVDKVLTAIGVSMKQLTSLTINPFDPSSSAVLEHLPTALGYSLNSVRFLELWITDERAHTEQNEVDRLFSYLTSMPKLEHLELMYDGGRLAMDHIGARILWPNLTYCELGDFKCTAEGLHNFIRRHVDTLRHIGFNDCSLQPGNWRPILFSILDAGKAQMVDVWYCSQSSSHGPKEPIDFKAEGTPAEVSEALSAFLEELPQS